MATEVTVLKGVERRQVIACDDATRAITVYDGEEMVTISFPTAYKQAKRLVVLASQAIYSAA